MTPKEKAIELVKRYFKDEKLYWVLSYEMAKQCALIVIDEMLNDDWYLTTSDYLFKRKAYWQEVKQEIEKL